MGVYLRLYRMPPTWAIEALSGRQSVGDLKEGTPDSPISIMPDAGERQETPRPGDRLALTAIDIQQAPASLDWNRNQLYVGRYYQAVADMLTGRLHSHENDDQPFEVAHTETDDPLDWAVYGRRICGWSRDFPLRYSNPADVEAITSALASVTGDDLRANLRQVGRRHPYDDPRCHTGYASGEVEKRLNQFLPHLLPNLREFFGRAREADEFTVHHVG